MALSTPAHCTSLYSGGVWNRIPKGPHIKRLLGLLVVGGCSAKTVEVAEPEAVAVQSPEAANVEDVKTVDIEETEVRSGLRYRLNSETPFTGTLVQNYENGQLKSEGTYQDEKRDRKQTRWHENGQKKSETTFKDGSKVSETKWDEESDAHCVTWQRAIVQHPLNAEGFRK